MSVRWVINRVTSEGSTRWPLVSRIVDPGRPTVQEVDIDDQGNAITITTSPTYTHASAISDGLPGQENEVRARLGG